MNSAYFMRLADRCIHAARRSFDLEAVTEFRKLAEEFVRKAEELDRIAALDGDGDRGGNVPSPPAKTPPQSRR